MIRGLSTSTIYIYWLFVLISFLWLCVRHRKNNFSILLIVIFYYALFALLGKSMVNLYRILTLGWTLIYLFRNNVFWKLSHKLKISLYFLLTFLIVTFLISYFYHNDSIFLVLSQLSRYLIPVILLLEFRRIAFVKPNYLLYYNQLFGQLLVIQILLNVVKLVLLREPYEGLVGSITGVEGGGIGTTLPLVGLLWFAVNTNLSITKFRDVLFLAGLLFIGFMTGKRAVWLIFPSVFIIYAVYVAKRKYPKQFLYILMLTPLFFYMGLRLSPTLNPENKIWGSFNIEYAYNYVVDYSMGKEDTTGERELGEGRVGAVRLLVSNIVDTKNYNSNTWLGYGMEYIYAADHEYYTDSDYYFGVNHRGSLTGVYMLYLAVGLVGTLLFFLYYPLLFTDIKYKRLGIILAGTAIFDFAFYNATIVRDPLLSSLMFFLIIFSSQKYNSRGFFSIHKRIGYTKIL